MQAAFHRLLAVAHQQRYPETVANPQVREEDIACLSPYIVKHIKRYGDYLIDMKRVPAFIARKQNAGVGALAQGQNCLIRWEAWHV